MKILLIRPSMINLSFIQDLTIRLTEYPTSSTFPILASLTPKEHTIEILDGTSSDVNYNDTYDLVGISAVTQEANKTYEIADEFRKRGVKVVIGGWHASSLPNEAKGHADSVLIGEAEDTWPILLRDMENGKLKQFYEQKCPVDLLKIPKLRKDIYPSYSNVGVYATRGCIFNCEFCSIANQKFRGKYRKRPVKDVIDEIRNHSNKIFYFFDNSLTVDPKYSKQLFRELKEIDKEFYAFGNIDILGRDEEFLRLAQEAGCSGWIIGFESIVQKSLDSVNKKNKADNYLSSVKKIHDYGMRIEGSFIFGFDFDTKEVFDETINFFKKSEIDFPNCRVLTPFPGTPIFDKFEKEGRIFSKDWSLYNYYNVVFKPKNMTPEELQDGWARVMDEFHSAFNFLKSLLNKRDQNIFSLINKFIIHEFYWKKYNL